MMLSLKKTRNSPLLKKAAARKCAWFHAFHSTSRLHSNPRMVSINLLRPGPMKSMILRMNYSQARVSCAKAFHKRNGLSVTVPGPNKHDPENYSSLLGANVKRGRQTLAFLPHQMATMPLRRGKQKLPGRSSEKIPPRVKHPTRCRRHLLPTMHQEGI